MKQNKNTEKKDLQNANVGILNVNVVAAEEREATNGTFSEGDTAKLATIASCINGCRES